MDTDVADGIITLACTMALLQWATMACLMAVLLALTSRDHLTMALLKVTLVPEVLNTTDLVPKAQWVEAQVLMDTSISSTWLLPTWLLQPFRTLSALLSGLPMPFQWTTNNLLTTLTYKC
jgi:hypothetical protein